MILWVCVVSLVLPEGPFDWAAGDLTSYGDWTDNESPDSGCLVLFSSHLNSSCIWYPNLAYTYTYNIHKTHISMYIIHYVYVYIYIHTHTKNNTSTYVYNIIYKKLYIYLYISCHCLAFRAFFSSFKVSPGAASRPTPWPKPCCWRPSLRSGPSSRWPPGPWPSPPPRKPSKSWRPWSA